VLAVGVFRGRASAELARSLRLDAVQVYGGGRCVLTAGRRRWTLIEPARSDAERRAGRGPSPRAQRAAWRRAAARRGRGVILAGGLTPGNAAEAAAVARPFALDVSSGVEKKAGRKDARLLRAFFAAARGEKHYT
jgi:phosphoribosylanthranilate isomerase